MKPTLDAAELECKPEKKQKYQQKSMEVKLHPNSSQLGNPPSQRRHRIRPLHRARNPLLYSGYGAV
jgi:hypothetical protein